VSSAADSPSSTSLFADFGCLGLGLRGFLAGGDLSSPVVSGDASFFFRFVPPDGVVPPRLDATDPCRPPRRPPPPLAEPAECFQTLVLVNRPSSVKLLQISSSQYRRCAFCASTAFRAACTALTKVAWTCCHVCSSSSVGSVSLDDGASGD